MKIGNLPLVIDEVSAALKMAQQFRGKLEKLRAEDPEFAKWFVVDANPDMRTTGAVLLLKPTARLAGFIAAILAAESAIDGFQDPD
jgi:hypothetical protein